MKADKSQTLASSFCKRFFCPNCFIKFSTLLLFMKSWSIIAEQSFMQMNEIKSTMNTRMFKHTITENATTLSLYLLFAAYIFVYMTCTSFINISIPSTRALSWIFLRFRHSRKTFPPMCIGTSVHALHHRVFVHISVPH